PVLSVDRHRDLHHLHSFPTRRSSDLTGHRARRGKARRTSSLEDVAGVGPKRRRDLLKHFGGLQELNRASIDEIAKAPGISKKLADRKSTRLNSSHVKISYAVFCLKKK